MKINTLLAVGLLTIAILPARAAEIGFVEDFALAPDRTVPLKQLIPGTEDFYYYHCLHYQNTEQFDKVEETLKAWINRYKYTERVYEILNRQALLTFDKNPDKTLAHIINRLNLKFDHQRELLNRKPNLPAALDQNLISRQTLTKRAMARYQNLQGFEPSALDWLVGQALDPDRRRHLLSLLQRPDYPNFVKLVVDDLNYKNSGGFGSFNIHRQLLLAQLDECLKLKPELLNQGNFVNAYLAKLHPNADVDWRNDTTEQQAYLDRLWAFVSRLAPVHNSLKAHVLYHRLELDRSAGIYDHDRFLKYLKLPRPTGYVEPKFMQLEESRRYPCNLNADYSGATLLGPVGDDEPLVRSYLMHFFEAAANYRDYEPYVRDDYLKHAFAETKIVNGLGDPEQWYSLLPPAVYQQLKQRVDLDFAFTNRQRFAPDAPVSLDLHVKNVPTLIVKVFEINAGNFYREQGREVDTDINLDGLVANAEKTYEYADPPLRRVRRHFEFAGLNQRGVYVIDFIGNGKSSRALVRKGKLRYLVRTSTAGQVFTVLDEQNQKLPRATLWLAGHECQPDEDGEINVPFTNQPNSQPIVLTNDGFASLETFQYQAENYSLEAGIFVDRESLLSRHQAEVLIRPSLRLNGEPVTLSILEDVKLQIMSTDLDGVSSSKEVPDFELHEDRESTYKFQVPQRLAAIAFVLRAKVKNLSQDKKIDLVASQSFQLNQIERSDKIEDLHLSKIDGTYVVDVLGKSGEPRADRAVQFQIKHRDFREPVSVSLQSNAAGRITLGPLADIESVTATGPEGTSHDWPLGHDEYTYHSTVNAKAGATITLPYFGAAEQATRSDLSLLELCGGTFVTDRFEALSVKDGMLHVTGLPAGDFDLLLKRDARRIHLRLTAGESRMGYVLGQHRQLELRGQKPLQIESIATGGEAVSIKLANATKFTRVHVFATRYEPDYASFDYLGRIRNIEPLTRTLATQRSAYVAGRNIGDEYRYIIERKYAKKFPGNMLARPSLLLNPWAIRATETSTQDAESGDLFGAAGSDARSAAVRHGGGTTLAQGMKSYFADLDFLGTGSAVLVNLKPNDDGVVEIPREQLGPHQSVHVVAVDPLSTTYRSASLAEVPRELVDLRLIAGLDPAKNFTQQKQISVVGAKKTFEVDDITSARFELYDSLPRVYALYATLSGDAKLAEFSFILNWHNLKPEERRELYSKYACHELNFFLKQKDAEFFDTVVQPYLKNKKDKTFLDRWLLGEELDEYLKPWSHAQLNVVERILLAQHVAGEPPRTARHVGDLYDLLTPDTGRFNVLFNTAVKGRALDTGDDYGLADAKQEAERSLNLEARNELRQLNKSMSAAMDPATPPADGAIPLRPGEPPAIRSAGVAQKKSKENAPARRRQLADEKAHMGKDEANFDVDEVGEKMYFERNGDRREQARQFYRKLDKTQEWVENNYYQLPIEQQNADLVTVNGFWRDYAAHDPATPFYSTNLAEASRNFAEMMFALSVLDLPMESRKHEMEFAKAKMTLTAGSPTVIFHEQILPSREMAADAPILVSQNFFRQSDRYRYEGNQRLDKYVTEEFLIHTIYGCQVVVTNPTSAPRKLDVLLQIPVGAMPVLGGQATRTVPLDLQPYQTQSLEYFFYFPAAGEFPHYPVHVSQDEKLLAYAQPVTLNVVRQLRNIDRESWDYVSQYGSSDDVLKFLKANNIDRLNLDHIAWRMQDKAFFEDVVRLLAARHVYNQTLWSYGLKHADVPSIREYLQHADNFVRQCGDYLVSPLLNIDPVVRKTYEHMDYRPLVNARAHQLGRERQILNDRLFAQYQRLMKNLTYRRSLDDNDLMAVTYYMLLQDRVEEALGYFGRVNAERLETRLQYDYFAAYLDYYNDQPKLAGALAANYADYPVDRWRSAFTDVAVQFKEIEGGAAVVVDDEDREQKQNQLATTAPSFDFKVESRRVVLNYQNLSAVHVNYYLMDIELLFSSNPFVQSYSGQFSYIRPNLSGTIELPAGGNSTSFDLPEELRNSNVLVEISGGGEIKSQAYYANSLAVQTIENYGQVRVAHAETSKPLSTVYVKVYAQLKDGRVKFYKDGYTDLRGRFDYTSLNTNELDFVDRFSILVLSEEHGAVVREAAPPKR